MLLQRLPEPGDVAVAEDPEAAGEERRALAVALHLLRREEPHERLGDRQADRARHPRTFEAALIPCRDSEA